MLWTRCPECAAWQLYRVIKAVQYAEIRSIVKIVMTMEASLRCKYTSLKSLWTHRIREKFDRYSNIQPKILNLIVFHSQLGLNIFLVRPAVRPFSVRLDRGGLAVRYCTALITVNAPAQATLPESLRIMTADPDRRPRPAPAQAPPHGLGRRSGLRSLFVMTLDSCGLTVALLSNYDLN